MSNLSLEELANLAAEHEDQTEEVTHQDFDNTPEAGVTVGRLISYIELGKQDGGSYQGKKKPDADKVRMEFELLAPKNIIKFERDGKEIESGQIVHVTVKKSLSDKASFKKLFKKLQYGREDKKHIAQMLGEAFIIHIYHNKVKGENGAKDKLYVNLDKDGEYGIQAPFSEDPLTQQRQAYNIRPHTANLRLFLWEHPTKEMWDSLFIDGTREVKKQDGTVEHVSKNWLQESILSAKNFNGSPLHQLLAGVSDDLLEQAEIEEAGEQSENPAEGMAQTDLEAAIADIAANDTPAASAGPEAPAEPQNEDPLAALGLTAG